MIYVVVFVLAFYMGYKIGQAGTEIDNYARQIKKLDD